MAKKRASSVSYTHRISTRAWRKIYDYLQGFREIYVRKKPLCRKFVEVVFWTARSGAQWHLLPSEYGYWNAVYRRFSD